MTRTRLQGQLNQCWPGMASVQVQTSAGLDFLDPDLNSQSAVAGWEDNRQSAVWFSVIVEFLLVSSKNIHESASFDRQLKGLNVNTRADTSDKNPS